MNTTEELYEDLCTGSYGDHRYETLNEDDPADEWIFWCKDCGAETWN